MNQQALIHLERRLAKVEALLRRPSLPGARVFNSTNISIPNNTETNFTFNSERYDTGNYHSTLSNTDRLTVSEDGIFYMLFNGRWASSATGYRQLLIRINGGTIIGASLIPPLGVVQTFMLVDSLYQLTAGDYVTVSGVQNSGGNLNMEAASNYSPEFMIHRVG